MSEVLRNVGPEDVDSASELVGRLGVRYQAKQLIKRVAAQRPEQLGGIQAMPEDVQRTRVLDLEEVEDAAKDAFGAKAIVSLESARVRGSGEEEGLWVELLWYTPSGRTARGAIPYRDLTASREQFGNALEAGEALTGDPNDPDVLSRALARANAELAELRGKGDSGDGEAAEPVPNYEKLKAPELAAKISDGEYDAEQLEALLKAEEAGADRATVYRALDARAEVLNPYDGYADANAGDVIAHVKGDGRTADDLKAIRAAEEAGENRTTVLKALDQVESAGE